MSLDALMQRSLRSWCSSSSARKVSNMGRNGDCGCESVPSIVSSSRCRFWPICNVSRRNQCDLGFGGWCSSDDARNMSSPRKVLPKKCEGSLNLAVFAERLAYLIPPISTSSSILVLWNVLSSRSKSRPSNHICQLYTRGASRRSPGNIPRPQRPLFPANHQMSRSW